MRYVNEERVNTSGASLTGEVRSSSPLGSDAGGAPAAQRSGAAEDEGHEVDVVGTRSLGGQGPSGASAEGLDVAVDGDGTGPAAPAGSATAKPKRASKQARAKAAVKGEIASARFNAEGMAMLDEVGARFGLSRSDALRQCVEMVFATLSSPAVQLSKEAQARQPVYVQVDADKLDELIEAVGVLSTTYARRAREVNAIGANVNQMRRLAYFQQDRLDDYTLRAMGMAVEAIRVQMNADAERDEKVEELITWLRPK